MSGDKRPLRFGVVGAGAISAAHFKALKELGGRGEVVAVADIRPEAARKAAADHGVAAFASLEEMLAGAEVDIVNICTPPNVHANQAVVAMRAGKHVVVEKPADVSVEATDRILSAAKETGRLATVISQHRFDPSSMAVYQAIQEGRLGKMTRGVAQVRWWRSQAYFDMVPWRGSIEVSGGGALISQSIHTVDLMLWMLGPVREVFAYSDILAHQNIEVEDSLVATLRFESGALGLVEASICAYPGLSARLEVSGDRGSANIDSDKLEYFHAALPGEETGIYGAHGDTNRADTELAAQASDSGRQDPTSFGSAHRAQIEDFIDAINGGGKPEVSLEDSRYAMVVICAMHESARIGKPVPVPTP